jgi:D-arabinonate dehydratase
LKITDVKMTAFSLALVNDTVRRRDELKITDVKMTAFSLGPRPRPSSDATYTETEWRFSVVEVYTDEGIVGICPGARSRELTEGPLKEMLLGEDPLNIERLWRKMYSGWCHPASAGEAVRDMSRIDIALWDVIGKALGQPVYRLLGGDRDRVPAYAAGGYYEPGKTVEDLQKEMTGYVGMGYDTVKMKVGRVSLEEDAQRVKAVREAIGEDVKLMVDGNHAWTPYQAILFGRMIEKYNPYWLEEPVPATDYEGGAEVCAALDIPVATGENEYLRWGFRDLIKHRAADIIQADPGVCGGYTEWRKIAAIATAHNLPLAPHGHGDIGAHAVASIPEGLTVETYPTHTGPNAEVIELFPIENSQIVLPQEPGMGWKVNEAVISRHRK